MPAVAVFLSSVFGGFYAWIVAMVGARAALVVALIGLIVTCMVSLLFIIKNLIISIGAVVLIGIPEYVLMAFWSVWPANGATVIASIFTADAAVFACKYHYNLVKTLAG